MIPAIFINDEPAPYFCYDAARRPITSIPHHGGVRGEVINRAVLPSAGGVVVPRDNMGAARGAATVHTTTSVPVRPLSNGIFRQELAGSDAVLVNQADNVSEPATLPTDRLLRVPTHPAFLRAFYPAVHLEPTLHIAQGHNSSLRQASPTLLLYPDSTPELPPIRLDPALARLPRRQPSTTWPDRDESDHHREETTRTWTEAGEMRIARWERLLSNPFHLPPSFGSDTATAVDIESNISTLVNAEVGGDSGYDAGEDGEGEDSEGESAWTTVPPSAGGGDHGEGGDHASPTAVVNTHRYGVGSGEVTSDGTANGQNTSTATSVVGTPAASGPEPDVEIVGLERYSPHPYWRRSPPPRPRRRDAAPQPAAGAGEVTAEVREQDALGPAQSQTPTSSSAGSLPIPNLSDNVEEGAVRFSRHARLTSSDLPVF